MEELMRTMLLTGASGYLGGAIIARHYRDYRFLAVRNTGCVPFTTDGQSVFDPLEPQGTSEENSFPVTELIADLTDGLAVERLVDDLIKEHPPIDVLINAAAWRGFTPLYTKAARDSAARVFAVNVLGPLRLSSLLAEHQWASSQEENIRQRRNIVNVSSSSGLFVYPESGQGLYGSAKAALNHLTYHMASDFWDIGIRANAVAPDSFPSRVPTQTVIDAIIDFDQGEMTGEVRQLT